MSRAFGLAGELALFHLPWHARTCQRGPILRLVANSEDLLTPVVAPDRLHRNFRILADDRSQAPARAVVRSVFADMPTPDGNFVRDFQTTGFNARLWELYVYSAGRCAGFQVTRPRDRPDFLFSYEGQSAWVEAVTANPPAAPTASQDRDYQHEAHHEVPIRLGGALSAKLKARYWDLQHVAGIPLLFAIADFHNSDVMRNTSAPLEEYLYAERDASAFDEDGSVLVKAEPVADHRAGKKVVSSGFFQLDGARNVSGVLFSNSGTLSKFTRIGFQEEPELYPDRWLLRWGVAVSGSQEARESDGSSRWERSASSFSATSGLILAAR